MNIYSNKNKLDNAGDILELISNARANESNKILVNSSDLIEEFFNLRSGIAGEFLQKFINYHMNVAILFKGEHLKDNPRFKEMVGESNSTGGISYFLEKEKAESWLLTL